MIRTGGAVRPAWLLLVVALGGGCLVDPATESDDVALEEPVYPDGFPPMLQHQEDDAPVPVWSQLVHEGWSDYWVRRWNVLRILGTPDDAVGRARFDSWSPGVQRGFALMVDQLDSEGLLVYVGALDSEPWEDRMSFYTELAGTWTLRDALAQREDVYTANEISSGIFEYLTRWNHAEWSTAWMRNDVPHGALHIGILAGSPDRASLHFDVFNPLYTNGAGIIDAPPTIFGRINWALMPLHRTWEAPEYAWLSRRSVNLYFLLAGRTPLSF